jgi:hypothetical protein
MMDEDLSFVMPYTQFEVLNRRYKVDLYYEQIKLAIEIYENHHEYQIDGDDLRIKEISGELGCSFEIVKVSDIENIYSEIKRLKKVILQKVNELKKQNHFVDWNPVSHSIEQVQRAYPNAIFFQATGQIDNNGYDPIRGPIKIDESKRSNADLFVTYSGGTYPTIISVCCINENTWNAFDPDPNRGFYQTGNEIVNHPLISSGMTQWNIKSNRYYGDNLKKT